MKYCTGVMTLLASEVTEHMSTLSNPVHQQNDNLRGAHDFPTALEAYVLRLKGADPLAFQS